ncbi:MAG: hypothetical protein R6V44_02635 [Paracoccaceae bacterium]
MRLAAVLLAPLLALLVVAAGAEEPRGPPRFPGERNGTYDLGPADPAPAAPPAWGLPVVVAPEVRPPRRSLHPPLRAGPPFRTPHPRRRRGCLRAPCGHEGR